MRRIGIVVLSALSLSACAIGNMAAVNKKETIGSGSGGGSAPAGGFIDAEPTCYFV